MNSILVRAATSGEGVEAELNAAKARGQAKMPLADDIALWPNIPHRLLEKYLGLRDRRDDLRAASRRVSEEMSEAHTTLQAAAARKKSLAESNQHLGIVGETHPGVIQADQQIEHVKATIARLNERHEFLSSASVALGRLFTKCDSYLKSNYPDLKLFDGDAPQLKNGETGTDAHERTARRVRSLREDRKEILAAPYPASITKKLARQYLAKRAEAAKPDVTLLVAHCDNVEFPFLGTSISNFAPTSIVKSNDPVGLLAWVFPKEFAAAVDREIDAEGDDQKALTNEQRIAKLAEIDGDILAAEREEAYFLELTGLLPREDMDIRAVLGLASDMPAPKRNNL